jgi:hypothetical protein
MERCLTLRFRTASVLGCSRQSGRSCACSWLHRHQYDRQRYGGNKSNAMARAATVGKNHDLVGRPQAQIHQCNSSSCGRSQRPACCPSEAWAGRAKLNKCRLIEDLAISRRKTFKRCGRSEAFVEHQQLVQKGRPGSPVTNDEDRGLLEHARANASRKDQSLDKI